MFPQTCVLLNWWEQVNWVDTMELLDDVKADLGYGGTKGPEIYDGYGITSRPCVIMAPHSMM